MNFSNKYNLSLSPNWRFVVYTLIVITLLVLSFSKYIETEILTWASQSTVNSNQICLNSSQSEARFMYSRIINLDRARRISRIYCIYKQTSFNVALELEYRESWTVVYIELLNKKNSLYWPLYI